MFKKLILSLPFVQRELTKHSGSEKINHELAIVATAANAQNDTLSRALAQMGNEKLSIEKKYQLALQDLEEKHVQVHELTKLLDSIVDYFVPVKQQPSPLEYKDIPELIFKSCSQKKKSTRQKKSAKSTK